MTRAWAPLALLLAAYQAGGAAPPGARPGTPVTVYAVVEDGQTSKPVPDISAADVDVTIDGQQAPALGVRCGEPPLTLVVLIDVSASLDERMPASQAAIRKAAERFLATLRDDDRVRVGVIAAAPALSPAFTSSRQEMLAAAREVLDQADRSRHGPSPIWDALDLAITALEPEPGRRAVILFTDGRTTGNRLGYSEVAAHAVTAAVAVNVVSPFGASYFQQSPTVVARVRPQVPLGRFADITGGVMVTSIRDWPSQPEKVLLTVLPRIRASCAISFTGTPADAMLHRLEVRVKRPGAIVHAPQGVAGSKFD